MVVHAVQDVADDNSSFKGRQCYFTKLSKFVQRTGLKVGQLVGPGLAALQSTGSVRLPSGRLPGLSFLQRTESPDHLCAERAAVFGLGELAGQAAAWRVVSCMSEHIPTWVM